MARLTGEQLKDSYQNLLTIGESLSSDPLTGQLENGKGDAITALGIGTDTPSTKLQVTDGHISTYHNINANTAGYGVQFFTNAGGSKNTIATIQPEQVGTTRSGNLLFSTSDNGAPTEAMRIDSSGNVGIGTDSTDATLTVSSGTANNVANFKSTDGTAYIAIADNSSTSALHNQIGVIGDNMYFATNDNEAMRIDSSGNVGIGETNPTATLNIKSASSSNSDNLAQVLTNSEFRLQYRSDDLSSLYIGGLGSTRGYLQGVNSAQDAGADISLNPYGGNVGIGTNTPTSISGYTGATLDNSTNGGFIDLQSNGATAFRFLTNGSVNNIETRTATPIVFLTNTTERMRIDSSGNVGIGETDPDSKLHLKSASAELLELERTSVGAYRLAISASDAFSIYDVGQDSDRLTIDSSGNVLVGKTDTSSAVVGTTLWSGGFLNSTVDGDYVARFNRNTSDGEIIQIYKDNTPVGSIGTEGGDLFFADASYGGIKPLGDAYAIVPSTNSGADYDNAMSLGASSIRWKDLYLSGSVYLGGTSSANALDDYEEGTHQATVTCETSGTITLDTGMDLLSYTKIGRLMTVTGQLQVSSVSSPTGRFNVSLPTAIADISERAGRSTGSIFVSNTSTNADNFFINGIEGQSFFTVYKGGSTNGTNDSADTFSGNEFITLNFSYVSA